MTLLDTFNGSGSLSANWSSSGGNAAYTRISDTAASSSAQVEEGVWWNATTFANDHFAEVTITQTASNAFIGPAVRVSSGGNYYGFYADNSGWYLIAVVGGVWSSLDSGTGGFANNDVVRLEVEGTTLRALVTRSGTQTEWANVTDSSLSSGSAGLTSWANNTDGRLDDFTAADLGAGAITVNVALATGSGLALPPVPSPGTLTVNAGLAVSQGIALPPAPSGGAVTWAAGLAQANGQAFPVSAGTPQIVRPVSDVNVGSWTTESGGTSNLYLSIDESSANDSDYVRSPVSPSASAYRVRLAAVSDPGVNTGRVLRYRIGVEGTGAMNWVVRVFNASTEVVSWLHSGISSLTTFEQTLSEAQAAALNNSAIDIEWEATLA
jgi:hypothetical protein